MDSNKRNTMNGSARAFEKTCLKENCDARVSSGIKTEDGGTYHVENCTKGHFQRRRRLGDKDAIKSFRAISSLPGP